MPHHWGFIKYSLKRNYFPLLLCSVPDEPTVIVILLIEAEVLNLILLTQTLVWNRAKTKEPNVRELRAIVLKCSSITITQTENYLKMLTHLSIGWRRRHENKNSIKFLHNEPFTFWEIRFLMKSQQGIWGDFGFRCSQRLVGSRFMVAETKLLAHSYPIDIGSVSCIVVGSA